MNIIYTDSGELQNCPAAVDMETGDLLVNLDVWDKYTEAEKQFIIGHELGHFKLDTDSEIRADEYSLKRNFGKIRKSLKSSFTALEKTNVRNEERWDALYENALQIDAENGNDRAAQELKKIHYKTKKTQTMRTIPGQITYINKDYFTGRNYYRADGDEGMEVDNDGIVTPPVIDRPRRGHATNGITIGDYYMSFTNLLLVAIAIILIVKLKN